MSSRMRRFHTVIDAPPPAVRTRLFTFMKPCASASPTLAPASSASSESGMRRRNPRLAGDVALAAVRLGVRALELSLLRRFFFELFPALESIDDAGIVGRVEAVVAVALLVEIEIDGRLDELVGGDVLVRLGLSTFLGRSRQSLRLCVIDPQFSHAPLQNLVAWNVLTPRLYHSPPSFSPPPHAF